MKLNSIIWSTLTASLLALPFTAIANTPASQPWTGVWQTKLDGVTAVTLTLVEDAGALDETIVFHIVRKQKGETQAHSGSMEPHTLIHPHLDGNTLSFQVVRGNGAKEVLNMAGSMTPEGKVVFQCELRRWTQG